MRIISTICICVTLVCVVRSVEADLFLLESGGYLEGELLKDGENRPTAYVVKTFGGAKITLTKQQVSEVVFQSEAERKYEKWLREMPATGKGNWQMAEFCLKNKLHDQRHFHLEQVLRYDPNHEDARRALGFQNIDGQWQKRDDYWKNRGYVRYKGQWRLKQEVKLATLSEEREKKEIEWRRQLKVWRKWVLKQRGKAKEGERQIAAIRDPHAVPALADLLKEDDVPKPLKLICIDVLGGLPNSASTTALVDRALNDGDADLREHALDYLAEWKSLAAFNVFVKGLKAKQNLTVNRAAEGLRRLSNAEATLPLIHTLTTKHKRVLNAGGGNMSVSFGNNGVSGLSAGGNGPKVIEQEIQNKRVLAALTTLHPGVNFLYDKGAWEAWYTDANTPELLDLRRVE
ncbi:MAG: HEAT repeat domain-containing protein [Pirellulaceae bacterium]|nr:HEAT repeat domain-containing protein [Pirellulaceae bacterium]